MFTTPQTITAGAMVVNATNVVEVKLFTKDNSAIGTPAIGFGLHAFALLRIPLAHQKTGPPPCSLLVGLSPISQGP